MALAVSPGELGLIFSQLHLFTMRDLWFWRADLGVGTGGRRPTGVCWDSSAQGWGGDPGKEPTESPLSNPGGRICET